MRLAESLGDSSKVLNSKSIDRGFRFIETLSMKKVEIAFSFYRTDLITTALPNNIALGYAPPRVFL